MTIIIDTREQTPWSFPENVKTKISTIKQGDYALDGDGSFSIERKNLDDFLGTISSGWERFQRELSRMDISGNPQKIIIVEGDFSSCCFAQLSNSIAEPEHNHYSLSPQFICSRIAELTINYRTSILFAGNAGYASALAYNIFVKRNAQLKGGFAHD